MFLVISSFYHKLEALEFKTEGEAVSYAQSIPNSHYITVVNIVTNEYINWKKKKGE